MLTKHFRYQLGRQKNQHQYPPGSEYHQHRGLCHPGPAEMDRPHCQDEGRPPPETDSILPAKGRHKTRRGQKKRYKDLLKANLQKCGITNSHWETDTRNRTLWKTTIKSGVAMFESQRCEAYEEKEDSKRRGRGKICHHQELPAPRASEHSELRSDS